MSTNVLVFGGSFSPPTLAHEAIIAECLRVSGFDEVWLLPSADRMDKIMSASEAHRLAMLEVVKQEVFGGDRRLKINDIEFKLPGPAQLYKTERALAKQNPAASFSFVFGGDSYRDMVNWGDGERLKNELSLVVVSDERPSEADDMRVRHIKLSPEFSDMSSSAARQALASGKGVNDLLSKPIIDYIAEHGLYK